MSYNLIYNNDNPSMVIKNGVGLLASSTLGIKIMIVFVIILISNAIGGIFIWHLYDNKSRELDSYKRQLDVQKNIDETNSKLKDLLEREKVLYPELLKQKKELSAANSKLDDIQAKINITGKEQINAEVSKMDLNDMSNYLNSLGYGNTIVSVE